jgi:soluble lytic murein transglycosylase-like protein
LSAACAAVADFLHDRDLTGQLVGWLFTEDVYRRSAGTARPFPSPVPALLAGVRAGAGGERWLTEHAMLGFCLASADARGILAVTVGLRRAGDLEYAEKRLFLYPLPGSREVQDALTVTPLETALLLAVARNESAFDPAARSRSGALGWVQIMPFHFEQRGITGGGEGHWSQPKQSLAIGSALLAENLRRYDGDPYRALAAYNAGPEAVARWTKQLGGRSDPELFLAWIGYPETRRYVEKVLVDREIYRTILAAEPDGASVPAGGAESP